jgi:hypothetical protein
MVTNASRRRWWLSKVGSLCANARGELCGQPRQDGDTTQFRLRQVCRLHATSLLFSRMSDRSRYYILGAFLLGVTLTTAYNKKSSTEENSDTSQTQLFALQQKWLSNLAKINDLDTLKKSLLECGGGEGAEGIKEGIEGCIGDTPLIKIKSLSEFTGCDILAKAEVQRRACICLEMSADVE